MELRTLTTFVRIAETGSFSRTAESLGYSQSAVTMQIKQLEAELGTPLFDRIGRHVRLTQAGERLLPYATDILATVRQAERVARGPAPISGKLRIGTAESYVTSILPPIIKAFSTAHPQVEISTLTPTMTELFAMLKRNDIDIMYFLSDKIDQPEWVKVSEHPERIFFVASHRSPLAREKNISIERLLAEPLILTEKGISYRYPLEQYLAARGHELHPFWEVGNTDVITRFLLDNHGISFLPEYVVKPHLASGQLTILHTECPDFIQWSQLVYHRHKTITPQMTAFLEMMVDALATDE